MSSKVIDLGVNQKHACDFLLVINSNSGCISDHFQDKARKWPVFPTLPCLVPLLGGPVKIS